MRKLFYISILVFTVVGCGKSNKPSKSVSIEPSEKILAEATNDFSIVLDDMKIEEEAEYMAYQHKYKLLTLKNDSLHMKELPWANVNKKFFKDHENDLGMEIVSKHDGKISKIAQPVGFGWAIGNEKHGKWEAVQKDSTNNNVANNNRRWRTSSTSSFFWLWMLSRRTTYRNDYNGYRSSYSAGRPYYGNRTSNGSYSYGTRSNYQSTNRRSFFNRRAQNTSRWNSLNSNSSRNSSRYSNSSSTRSRSGGTGK